MNKHGAVKLVSGIALRISTAMIPAILSAIVMTTDARGQSSSLLGAPDQRQSLTLSDGMTTIKLEPPREIQLNDQIMILVSEKSQVINNGQMNRRLQSTFDARLQNWVRLRGLDLVNDPLTNQATGAPRARGQLNTTWQSSANMQAQDSMQFHVTATVVDIRPNGNLVLEAHQSLRNNDDVREISLSGIVRRQDVLPNNTVSSEKLAELRIYKREAGEVRDAYRRGWFLKALDKYKFF
jgi:flagellar L-ring protein precursor FlgH